MSTTTLLRICSVIEMPGEAPLSLFIIFQSLTFSLFAGYLELNSPGLNALLVKLSCIHNYVVMISSTFFFQNALIKAI